MSEFDYIAEANLTLSNQFHGKKVTLAEFKKALQAFINAGNELDKIKKALFYGKGEDIGMTASVGAVNCDQALVMFNGYNEGGPVELLPDAERHFAEVMIHGTIGKATEAVEEVELLFKTIFGFDKFDAVNMLEEIGDGGWYDAIRLKLLGSDFPTEQRRNIAKLRKRFPQNFNEYDAQNRDLFAERAVLENPDLPAEYVGKLEAMGESERRRFLNGEFADDAEK